MKRLLLFLTLIAFSCTKQKVSLNSEELKFADIMVDVYMANGAANQVKVGNKDSLRDALVVEILKQRDLDTNTFRQKLRNLEKDPERFKLITDTVVRKIELLSNN